MPYGVPFSDEERKKRHLLKYGTLENFPEERKGEGRFWKEKDDFEAQLMVCKQIEDDAKRASCIFDVLNRITRLQDVIQLSIPPVNESVVSAQNLINDANALILEASKWKGDIRMIANPYTLEKIKRIVNDWNAIAHNLNISVKGANYPIFEIREVKKRYDIPEYLRKENFKTIFKDMEKVTGE